MKKLNLSSIAVTVALSVGTQVALASNQSESNGFVEDSKVDLLNRNMYLNRDFRKGGFNKSGTNAVKEDKKGYAEEWGHSVIGTYQSGFTQGTVGFGVDAYAMTAFMLDTGGSRTGTGMTRTGDDLHPDSNYSKVGGAVKLQVSNTVVKYGNMQVETPVFDTGDTRLLPEIATGLLVTSDEIENLNLVAGHFTALNSQTTSRRDSVTSGGKTLKSANILGGTYAFNDNLKTSVYLSDVEDFWKKKYLNVNYGYSFSEDRSVSVDAVLYNTKDQGAAYGGEVDSNIWSLAAGYTFGPHTLTLVRQVSTGKGMGDPYGIDGGDTIYLGTSLQYADFNNEDEKSWQFRYDVDMAAFGVPGLSLMARYAMSDDIDIYDGDAVVNTNGKAWERNLQAAYVVQSGTAKDLSFKVRHATYRSSDLDDNIDEIRVIVSYPLSIM